MCLNFELMPFLLESKHLCASDLTQYTISMLTPHACAAMVLVVSSVFTKCVF